MHFFFIIAHKHLTLTKMFFKTTATTAVGFEIVSQRVVNDKTIACQFKRGVVCGGWHAPALAKMWRECPQVINTPELPSLADAVTGCYLTPYSEIAAGRAGERKGCCTGGLD